MMMRLWWCLAVILSLSIAACASGKSSLLEGEIDPASVCTLSDKKVIEELIHQLGDPSIEVRSTAEEEIARMGANALPPLKIALQDPDSEVACRAFGILEHFRKSTEWKAYRDGGQIGLELQAVRSQRARDALDRFKGMGIHIGGGEPQIITSEDTRRLLETIMAFDKIRFAGVERIQFDGTIDLGVPPFSPIELFKRLAHRISIDVMLTEDDGFLVGERRAIFDAITR